MRLEDYYADEWQAISNAYGPNAKYIGLALSGGGIRSASYCVGALQGLYDIGVLTNIGYLSTVSGGGYAASWYMAHQDNDLFSPGSQHLQHLNQNGSYLNRKHYSKNTLSLVGNVGTHLAFLPWYGLTECVTSYEMNCRQFKYTYRKRLAETFQYDEPFLADFTETPMADFLPSTTYTRPLWIINMHMALSGDNGRHKNRSGDLFELTPIWAGADSVDYITTRTKQRWMSPFFGVAASGAAADAASLRTGPYGPVLLRMFNLNLGWYVNNWNNDWMPNGNYSRYLCNNLRYYVGSISPLHWFGSWHYHTRTPEAKKLYLTDGGHFDNLGLYALVKRGCRLIFVVDATYDPQVSDWSELSNPARAGAFDDFRKTEAKIKADFGADIEMEWDKFYRLPAPANKFGTVNHTLVFTGRIKNLPVASQDYTSVNPEVRIVYVKAAYSLEQQLLNAGTYIDAMKVEPESEFPHDTTFNQFYSEEKIVAYRELARRTIVEAETKDRVFSANCDWAKRLSE